jgi:hypothetical protein
MDHSPLPIKGIGDQSKKAQNQRGDDNTRPNKNCPDHKLNPRIMEQWNDGMLGGMLSG